MTKKEKPDQKTITDIKAADDSALSTAIQEAPSELRLGEKFKAWTLLFMDKGDRKYWGNATQCALKIYDTDNYHTAESIGSQNLKKLKLIGAIVLEAEGMGFGELMKIGASKMLKGSYSDWESLMERVGYFEAKNKKDDGNTFNVENMQLAIIRDRKARGLPIE